MAPTRFTLGPTMNPARMIYPVGRMVRVEEDVRPPVMTPESVVPRRLAPEISAFVRVAVVRLHPDISAPTSDTPERSIFVKFRFWVMTPGPRNTL